MKRLLSLSILSLVLCLNVKAQDLIFDETEHSFGKFADTTLTYSFLYCNQGQDTIIINRIETTCGIIITSKTDTIAPDMGGTIDIFLDVSEISGKFKHSIYIYSNQNTIRIRLNGNRIAQASFKNEDYTAIPRKHEKKKKEKQLASTPKD